MKKSLIALAVLAASGAAMAQSSVTLYGVVDAFVGSNKLEVNGVGQRQTVVDTSGVNGSRWGLKGSEDLGNGMKAIFQLESGFDASTGASGQGGLLFGRQAFIGLNTGFGTVSLGRQYSAYDALHSATNHNYDAFTFNAATGTVGGKGVGVSANGMADYTSRVNNSIAFTSADYSGFSGAVVYGFGENKTATQDKADSVSVHIKYANGPLLVGYAFQQEEVQGRDAVAPSFAFSPATGLVTPVAGILAVGKDKNKYNLVGATYDFGVVKLNGSYNTAKNNTFKDKEGNIGVVVPFGAAAISAGYVRSKSEGLGVERTGKGYSILATYAVSKRTGLYAGAQNTKAYVLNSPLETQSTVYGLGVRHSF